MYKKISKKVINIILFMIMVVCITGCRKSTLATYHFHFYVEGGNGKIQVEKSPSFEIEIFPCEEHKLYFNHDFMEVSNYCFKNGGSNGFREQTFIAIPDDGYKVKEWVFNGKIVEGNISECFVARVTSEDDYHGIIIVKFEKVLE